LSFTCELGNSACVDPWHAEHTSPPCPLEKRKRDIPVPGVFGLVAKVVFAGMRNCPPDVKADVYRICPLFCTAVPV